MGTGRLDFVDGEAPGVTTGGAHSAVQSAELRADAQRLRLMLPFILGIWTAAISFDLIVRLAIQHASLTGVLAIRVGGIVLILVGLAVMRRPDVTAAQLRNLRASMFAAFAIAQGLQGAADVGAHSIAILSLIGLVIVQAMTSPRPFGPSLVRLGAASLLGLATGLAATALDPALAPTLASPEILVAIAAHYATILACVVALAIGAGAYWRLRRQVFARRLVGRYRLVEQLGKGGMGEVWRARHPGLRRDVAIKILRSDQASGEQIARFEAEIRALSELSHPNTVRVYDSGVTDDGLCYYAMELLRGETLEARVRRAGPLSPEAAGIAIQQIGRALAEAHDRGIVHRDLSPRNVFLDSSTGAERAKLIDFGIAARTTDAGASAPAGTPAYMAPEQARGDAATPAADIYALGGVWYFALTAQPPFARDAAAAALLAHATDELVPPSQHVAAIPPGVDAAVARCLAKDPTARFASTRAIEHALGAPASQIAIPIDELARLAEEPSASGSMPVVEEADGADQERRASYVRLQTMLACAAIVWAALGVIDVVVSRQPGALGLPYFLAVRTASVAIVLGCVRYLRRGQPSPRMLVAMRATGFGTLAISCALVAVGGRGFDSPLIATIVFVIVAQGLAQPGRVRASMRHLGALVLAFNAALWLGVLVRGLPISLGVYLQYVFVMGTLSLLMSFMGKTYWSLRQRLFEQRVVGRYRLKRMLGAGGMGQVWSADHPGLGREVAIKLLKPSDASPELVTRFETEIHALTELAHPNTVRVYDCGTTDDGYWFYVMERLQGQTLTQAIHALGVIDGKRAIRLARQIASALVEAHAAGIVHRDLKPDNLFLTTVEADRELVKVIDFGVAKRALEHRLTQTGIAVGTPAFMAPEQAIGGAVDGRADIYALGIVMFYMLTGQPPFTAESTAILLMRQVRDEAPLASSFIGGVPIALDHLIARCLEKNPADRFATMAELERELADLARDYATLAIAAVPAPFASYVAAAPDDVTAAASPAARRDDTPR